MNYEPLSQMYFNEANILKSHIKFLKQQYPYLKSDEDLQFPIISSLPYEMSDNMDRCWSRIGRYGGEGMCRECRVSPCADGCPHAPVHRPQQPTSRCAVCGGPVQVPVQRVAWMNR